VKERSVSGGTTLDKIDQLVLTHNFGPIVRAAVTGKKALTVKAPRQKNKSSLMQVSPRGVVAAGLDL